MIYFIDFDAISLGSHSFPIEVAWVDQDGQSEEYLIRPHPEWLATLIKIAGECDRKSCYITMTIAEADFEK